MKLRNIHHSHREILRKINSEINHYVHLCTKYPDDPCYEDNLRYANYLEKIYNFMSQTQDSDTDVVPMEQDIIFVMGFMEELVASGAWKLKKKVESEVINQVVEFPENSTPKKKTKKVTV